MEALSPDRTMRVTLMLADAAQVADGKLNLLGGGWTVTGPAPSPFAIAGIIEVPWSQTDGVHELRFELIDLDGNPILIQTPDGVQPVRIDAAFEVQPAADARVGAYSPFPFVVNSPPLPLPPGSHLEWRATIDGRQHEDWRLAFSTRPASGDEPAVG